ALLAYHVNRVCDCHEAAWRAGRRPRIEDFLTLEEEPGRTVLLRDLLAAELAARRQQGETPDRQEYRDRFPGDAGLIDALFAEAEPTCDRRASPGRQRPVGAGTGPREGADCTPLAERATSDLPGDDRAQDTAETNRDSTDHAPTSPGGDAGLLVPGA